MDVESLTQHHGLRHHTPRRRHVRGLETLPRPRQVRRVVRVLNRESPQSGAARHGPEADVHRGPRARARLEPRAEVDEHRARELATLERGVGRDVRVVHGDLRDLRGARLADERVDDEPGVVGGLDVWLRRGVDGGAVDDRAIQADGLNLIVGGLSVSILYVANN